MHISSSRSSSFTDTQQIEFSSFFWLLADVQPGFPWTRRGAIRSSFLVSTLLLFIVNSISNSNSILASITFSLTWLVVPSSASSTRQHMHPHLVAQKDILIENTSLFDSSHIGLVNSKMKVNILKVILYN